MQSFLFPGHCQPTWASAISFNTWGPAWHPCWPTGHVWGHVPASLTLSLWAAGPSQPFSSVPSFLPSPLLLNQWRGARKRTCRPEAFLGEAPFQLDSNSCRGSDLLHAWSSSPPPSSLWFHLLSLHILPSIAEAQCHRSNEPGSQAEILLTSGTEQSWQRQLCRM